MSVLRFVDLPEVILDVIREFLSKDDYHYLLNCSKKHFQLRKYYTIYFTLTKASSDLFFDDLIFRDKVYSLVHNPRKQISLNLSSDRIYQYEEGKPLFHVHRVGCFNIENIELFQDVEVLSVGCMKENFSSFPISSYLKDLTLHLPSGLSDVESLRNLQSLSLHGCRTVVDISCLRDVENLKFSYCPLISDFSCLGRQKRLHIIACSGLSDVSNFSKVKHLTLEHCDNLCDIQSLYGIYDLSLMYCQHIHDISGLGNHYRLKIISYVNKLTGYQILNNIPHIHLQRCCISDLSILQYAKTVTLIQCLNVVDLSPLAAVRSLTVSNCINVADVRTLCDIPQLTLLNLPKLNSSQPFQGLGRRNKRLTIECLNPVADWSFAKSCEHLVLQTIPKLQSTLLLDNSSIKHIQTIEFLSCSSLLSTYGLGEIPHLIFQDCRNLENIEELGRNKSIHIVNCLKIVDFSSLSTVPFVSIIDCGETKDYSCLSNVPRLKIIQRKSNISL